MANYKLITPEGTKDYIFHEAAERSRISNELSELFATNSYSHVITPAVEYLDVFGGTGHAIPVEDMYKLTDNNGRLMVLRPDSTTPIARLCATRLKEEKLPIRLFYKQAVYSATRQMSGKQDEVLQAGIELVGSCDKKADLEVLWIAVSALKKLSPSGFRIELSHIGLFNGLVDMLNIDDEKREELRLLIEGKNYPTLNDVLDKLNSGNAVAVNALKQLPRLFGGDEVFTLAKEIFKEESSNQILAYLKEVYDILKQICAGGEITVDLGTVNRTDYYTGIVFKGYMEECLGEAVLSGGRYDKLMSGFYKDMGAVGFAINIDAAAVALKKKEQKPTPDALVFFETGHEAEGLILLKKLYEEGRMVESALCSTLDEATSYATQKGISSLYAVGDTVKEMKIGKGGGENE